MPTIEQNISTWNGQYEWPEQGDEWSRGWGGVAPQWFGTILPRIKSFVPAGRLLEIAPGFGRWTQFLRPLGWELVLVDISDRCIEACRKRFAVHAGIDYHVNDGRSLGMIADNSIDFAFSFDSLVHAEFDVIESYFRQFAEKLTPDGVAFVHHSNFGEYVDRDTGRLATGIDNRHWRALSVSGERVRDLCTRAGLVCLSQEIINWGQPELNDAFTVVARPGSRWGGKTVTVRNGEFMQEAAHARRLARLYDWGSMARGAAGEGEAV